MDGRVLRRHRHHLAATERDRTQIAVLDVLDRRGVDAGLVDLILCEGDLHAEGLGRAEQPVGVFLQLVDLAAIDALALEHAGTVMQAMGQHMGLGVLPGHQFAVIPKRAIALVERDHVCHPTVLPGLPASLGGPSFSAMYCSMADAKTARAARAFSPPRRAWQP